VEIESDEDSAEEPFFKRLRPTTTTASHSSTVGRLTSLRDQPPNASLLLGLLMLEDGGESVLAAPSAPELPVFLQHALKGFQIGVTEDLDETATRERLGLNFGSRMAQSNTLITRTEVRVALVKAKAKEDTALLAHAFTTRETALKQELTSFRQVEKDLSKRLHDKSQEAVELEAKILPLRTRAIELEEAAEASKAKMTRLEESSTSREVQLGRVEAELLRQTERFKNVEAELTEEVVELMPQGSRTPLLRLPARSPRWTPHPSQCQTVLLTGRSFQGLLPLSLYLVTKRTVSIIRS